MVIVGELRRLYKKLDGGLYGNRITSRGNCRTFQSFDCGWGDCTSYRDCTDIFYCTGKRVSTYIPTISVDCSDGAESTSAAFRASKVKGGGTGVGCIGAAR